MATFGTVRAQVLAKAKVRNHFEYLQLGSAHAAFWERINAVEYARGYTPEYLKPGTPGLCDMDLLTDAELLDWVSRAPA